MKILVAIASYGTGNDRYLRQLLATYRAMPYAVHIVVLSNVPRDLGPDVEVIVGSARDHRRDAPAEGRPHVVLTGRSVCGSIDIRGPKRAVMNRFRRG